MKETKPARLPQAGAGSSNSMVLSPVLPLSSLSAAERPGSHAQY